MKKDIKNMIFPYDILFFILTGVYLMFKLQGNLFAQFLVFVLIVSASVKKRR